MTEIFRTILLIMLITNFAALAFAALCALKQKRDEKALDAKTSIRNKPPSLGQ